MLVIILLSPSTFANEDTRVKCDLNGHYYDIVYKIVNWNDAKSYAEKQQFFDSKTGITYKGHLATITSSEENSWIFQNMISPLNAKKDYGFWLGGHQEEGYENRPSEGWHWVTGEPWSWTNWCSWGAEPNDMNGGERHLEMWGTDIPCKDNPSCKRIGFWNDEVFGGWTGVTEYLIIEYDPEIIDYNQINQYIIGSNYIGPIQIQRIIRGNVIDGWGIADTVQVDSKGDIVKAWTQLITSAEIAAVGEIGYAIRKSDETPTSGTEAIAGAKFNIGSAEAEALGSVEYDQNNEASYGGSLGIGAGPVEVSVSANNEGWVGIGTLGIGAEFIGLIHTWEPTQIDPNSIPDKIMFDIIHAVYGPTKQLLTTDMVKASGTRSDLTQPPKYSSYEISRFTSTIIPPAIPGKVNECEPICGTFTLANDGNHFDAVWENGAIGELRIVQWDSYGVKLERKDTGGRSNGLVATYTGVISGNKIENGKVTWTWSAWPERTNSGTWNANW